MGSNFKRASGADLMDESSFAGYVASQQVNPEGPLITTASWSGEPQYAATSFTVSDILQGNFNVRDPSDDMLIVNKALSQDLKDLYTNTPASSFGILGSGPTVIPLNPDTSTSAPGIGGSVPPSGSTSPGSTGPWVISNKFAPNTAGAFIAKALTQIGDPYGKGDTPNDTGGGQRSGGADPTNFDCSGLVYWASQQVGYVAPADVQSKVKAQYSWWGGTWSWSQGMIAMCLTYGTNIAVDVATKTAGALLLKYAKATPGAPPSATEEGHVAISLGNGYVLEATSFRNKVSINPASRTTWHIGAYLPGMRIGPAISNLPTDDGNGGIGTAVATGGGWNGAMTPVVDFKAPVEPVYPSDVGVGTNVPGIEGVTSDSSIPGAAPYVPPAGFGTNENGRTGEMYTYGLPWSDYYTTDDGKKYYVKNVPGDRFKMKPSDVAKVFYKYGGWRGTDLVNMVAIAMREVNCYPHTVVKRVISGDYSFGLLGMNMIGDMGPSRAKWFGITNYYELLNPIVMARAGRLLFDSGQKSNNDPYWHWGGYKGFSGTSSFGQYIEDARKAVQEAGLL